MFKEKKPKYYLDAQGEFVIENYNYAKPFANFLPGIAGKYGVPMWVFYVNRSQGIISFGTKDKDHSILEFFPANKAWQLVSTYGFRTFIKSSTARRPNFYEPFHNGWTSLGYDITNRMSITSYDLKIEETNLSLGLKIKVEYFNIPNDSYAGLARIVTVENLTRDTKKIKLLDGLPQIVPYGTGNLFLKKLGRTIDAWMDVENLENQVPFYKLDVDPTDRPEVIHIKAGNFYLGFHYEKEKPEIIRPIVDPQSIFGPVTDFSCPREFLSIDKFSAPEKEIAKSKMPCGFLLLDLNLSAKCSKTFYTVVGHMRNSQILNSSLSKITSREYLTQKKAENKKLILDLQSDIDTESGSQEFNLYAKQTYLDNIMRGGYPFIFKNKTRKSVFYLYSRKHGDLERDYNKFKLSATYYSQGNGNYRDINQNRRCDIWFNPDIEDENVINFFNFIQTDGFNPLIVKGLNYILKDVSAFKSRLKDIVEEKNMAQIISFLEKPFAPGDAVFFIEENKIKLKVTPDDFLNILITHSIPNQDAEHGEGFWTDHWHYNLDLLDTYLGVYPEKLKEIIFESQEFTFYDNTEIVKPRNEKYLLYEGRPRQLGATASCNAKKEMIRERTDQPHVVRQDFGKGKIYRTTLINKLLCLLVNKMSSLDPFGCGIEMEANKPNWFDSLNGLPALFGSSLCETFQLKRLVLFMNDTLEQTKVEKIYITEEIYRFLIALTNLMQEFFNSDAADKNFQYWDKSYTLKENYRRETKFGLSGKELETEADKLMAILNLALKRTNQALDKAYDKKQGIYSAYFINEVVEYVKLNPPFIRPKEFSQRTLPLFLEGQMHALRLTQDSKEARKLHKATRASLLYDQKLKMYKVTAPLDKMPEEIGRCRAFTPGWLENESVWLHMEYKYMLELLRQGLYEEFYADFKNALIPFQKGQRYGRSILENSSFLVSSAFPDKKLHGNGFVARLSGSTAEFSHIWLTMNLGRRPFFLNEKNELNIRLEPILCGWLFQRRGGTYGFNFLSKVRVTYHNPKRKNTFGKDAVKIKNIILKTGDGKAVEIPHDVIPAPYAQQIRSRQITRIDAYLD